MQSVLGLGTAWFWLPAVLVLVLSIAVLDFRISLCGGLADVL
jgi:hypothetical protein